MSMNKERLMAFSEAWVAQDRETLLEAVSDDFQFRLGNSDNVMQGKQAFAEWLQNMQCEQGDSSLTHKDIIVTAEQGAVTGEIEVIGASKTSRYAFCDILRFKDDKISHLTAYLTQFDHGG